MNPPGKENPFRGVLLCCNKKVFGIREKDGLIFWHRNSMMSHGNMIYLEKVLRMDYKLLMDTAMMAGKLMLQSGAETYRVEDTMHHILKTSNLEKTEILVIMTGISASISGEGVSPISMAQRVERRSTNLSIIEQVNQISRRYCGGEISLDEAYACIRKVKSVTYPKWVSILAPTGVAVGFTGFFNGTWYDVAATLIVGIILSGVMLFGSGKGIPDLIQDILNAVCVGLVALIMKRVMGNIMNLDTVIIGSIMPLVPGVAITNAVRDTLQGDYISGCARILEAFLKASFIALGIGIALSFFGTWITGGIV